MKRQQPPAPPAEPARGAVQPAHLLLVGVLATVALSVFVTRDSGTVNMVFVALAVASAGLVAAAAYQSLAAFVSPDAGEQTDMLAGRTRAALEREKFLVLRSIKEIEFDRAMRKISDADFQEMATRLRARAAGLIRQLDGGGGYHELIERDLAKLAGGPVKGAAPAPAEPPAAAVPGVCPACATANDADARFCKACGQRLEVRS